MTTELRTDTWTDPETGQARQESLFKPGFTTFWSKHQELVLIRRPGWDEPTNHGIRQHRPVQYEFQGGYLWVREGQDKLVDMTDRGEVEQDALTWLRAHPMLDSQEPGAFSELEPPPPSSTPVIMQIGAFAAAKDVDGLSKLYEDESAGYDRRDVKDAIEGALAQLEADSGDIEAD